MPIPLRERAGGLSVKGMLSRPRNLLMTFVPDFVRHLLHAGIGRLEYCLNLVFERSSEIKRRGPRQRLGELLYDITVSYRPGPYTMVFRLDYVLDGLECDVPLERGGISPLARLHAVDRTKMGGRHEFFQSDRRLDGLFAG